MSFLIRWLHVSSAAFIFGGALLIFLLLHFHRRRDAASQQVVLDVMRVFEVASWASLGLVIATGIGNLGQFGDSLPDSRSDWGRELTLKLVLVVVFLLFSGVRTVAVSVAASAPDEKQMPRRAQRHLAGLYGATAVFAASIVAVAVALAHF